MKIAAWCNISFKKIIECKRKYNEIYLSFYDRILIQMKKIDGAQFNENELILH